MAFEYYNSRKRYKPRKQKAGKYKPRSARGMHPFFKVLIVIILLGAAVAGGLFAFTDIRFSMFAGNEVTPEAVATPTPTAHPLEELNLDDLQHDVNVTDTSYRWFSDAYVYGEELIFCAGEIVNNDAYMTSLMKVETSENGSRVAQRVNVVLENDHIMYPVFNDEWLVFLDAKASGGGKIVCYEYGGNYDSPTLIKEVYTGHPALFLSGKYLVWTERTGTSMDKLFACDLETLETATVQMFNRITSYGVSKPYIDDDLIVWADVDTENSTGSITSQVCTLNIETGEYISYKPEMYAHDPKTNGSNAVAWMDSNHGPDSNLYVAFDYGEPILVAEGIVDFYIDDSFLAYQKDSAVYVYIFSTGDNYKMTRNAENAQIIGASGGCVMWNDLSFNERELLKFAKIPE